MALNTTDMKHQAREFARQLKRQVREWHQRVRQWLEKQKPQGWKKVK